ncbi:histidine kinase dimerization/phospho-acceptor domain-containing protein [Parablastomonas sp. CN1-191]|uniref:histidine kinase dimerization/phospho-acceptor domain-containing protein n=1 Tax=Parablastomonas sp. CN1-191 TaxID=3400908 RepID=UPI003BF8B89F
MRQLLHELRTPVNAIQGFAEIIQQQLFGPTPHEYRALAAAIAVDAARMLAAFEELDRLVRLDSGTLDLPGGGCDFAAVVSATAAQLEGRTGARFDVAAAPALPPITLAEAEAERIAWRVLATLLGTAAEGENMALKLDRDADGVRLVADLPHALAVLDDKALFHAVAGAIPQTISAGIFGVGFALRLASAEVRSAGGTFERSYKRLQLTLPGGSAPDADDLGQEADATFAGLPAAGSASNRASVRPLAGIAGDGPVAQRLELAAHNG